MARYDTSYVMAPSFHGMIRVEGGTCWLVSRRAKDQYTIFFKKIAISHNFTNETALDVLTKKIPCKILIHEQLLVCLYCIDC